MSAPDTAQQHLRQDIDALIAAVMADAPVAEMIPITNRIAAAVDQWDTIPAPVVAELRSAVDLMLGGQGCATITALLAARSELDTSPS